jgi:UDP-N-acetyl-D-galactosamine dehydrogenase
MKADYSQLAKVSLDDLGKLKFDAVIFAVAHKQFMTLNPKDLINDNGIIYDVKGIFPAHLSDGRL